MSCELLNSQRYPVHTFVEQQENLSYMQYHPMTVGNNSDNSLVMYTLSASVLNCLIVPIAVQFVSLMEHALDHRLDGLCEH